MYTSGVNHLKHHENFFVENGLEIIIQELCTSLRQEETVSKLYPFCFTILSNAGKLLSSKVKINKYFRQNFIMFNKLIKKLFHHYFKNYKILSISRTKNLFLMQL